MNMADANQYTVYVPDQREALYFPTSFSPEEVRQALVSGGRSSVGTAELVVSGNTLTFRRPAGGTKGRL